MVHREDQNGLIVISQPAHSWASGQLARAWGSEAFGEFAPVEEVCLAAEQHDIGFLEWEKAPTLSARTGRPHDFMDMPTNEHLAVWSASVLKMMEYNRYAALLVCLHVTGLCQRHQIVKKPREAEAIQGFLNQQHAIQTLLLASLREDPLYLPHSTDETVARNRKLVSTWDWMSLLLCMGSKGEHLIEDVPAKDGTATLKLAVSNRDAAQVTIAPWPFRPKSVKLVCEGRRLAEKFSDEEQMRAALRLAVPEAVTVWVKAGQST